MQGVFVVFEAEIWPGDWCLINQENFFAAPCEQSQANAIAIEHTLAGEIGVVLWNGPGWNAS